MEHLSGKDFKEKIFDFTDKNAKYINEYPVVIDFYAIWCGPCMSLTPTLEKISDDLAGKIDFYKVNVDDNDVAEIVRMFKIRSIPTVAYISKGGIVNVSTGNLPESQVRNNINLFLNV